MQKPSSPPTPLGPPPAALQAVIFDLGGTLIDYLGGAPSWPEMEYPGVAALHDILRSAGFPMEAEAFRDSFVRSMDERWRAATQALSDPPTLSSLIVEACHAAGFDLEDELHQAAVAAYCTPIAARAAMAHGAQEILAWLKAHDVRIGLISNTVWPPNVHRLDLERYRLLSYFDATIFSSEVELWKPDPRIFRLALERIGAVAERSVFIGDRLLEDVQGAQRAGLRAIFVEGTQDYGDIPADTFIPDARITRLTDLPDALASIVGDDS